MKIIKILALGLAIISLPLMAAVGNSPIVLQDTNIHLAQVTGFNIRAGENSGTAQMEFTVKYGNFCVAQSYKINPMTAVSSDTKGNRLRVILDQESVDRHLMCPMIYMPVEVSYSVQIANLYPGARYTVEVVGTEQEADLVTAR